MPAHIVRGSAKRATKVGSVTSPGETEINHFLRQIRHIRDHWAGISTPRTLAL